MIICNIMPFLGDSQTHYVWTKYCTVHCRGLSMVYCDMSYEYDETQRKYHGIYLLLLLLFFV